jgi:hypothetical protein
MLAILDKRTAVLLFSVVLGAGIARAQDVKVGTQALSTVPSPETPKPGEFYSKELDLHFNYPVEMQVLDAAADMEQGHLNLYGKPGDTDPEHQEAIRCGHALLDADLPEENAPKRLSDFKNLWIDDSEEYKKSRKPEPIYAKIVMLEFDRSCLPKKLKKNENDALGTIALTIVSMPGVNRQPQPLWFDVAGRKIHMNSGVGRPIVNGRLASAPIVIMSMSTEWNHHLLAWMFISNDIEIFNQMTKSTVQLGKGPWGTMFLPDFGLKDSGTPITILPK